MQTLILGLRATLFYSGYGVSIIWFGLSGGLLALVLRYPRGSRYIISWNRFIIWWLKISCNLRFEVSGMENLPDRSYVALSKHQSQWETYCLQFLLSPVAVVLKKELLSVPFFGWGLRLTAPIAIDRSNPKQALRQTLELGKQRINEGASVLIFPEGTRIEPDKVGKYARGGANIAIKANAPIVPIAHNAGVYWPSDQFIKYPGVIKVVIGKAIDPADQDSRSLTEQVQNWIEAEISAM